MNDSSKSYKP
ncbi:hypothetical protein OYC64_002742 [Pagothenia borchgrevinki]|uniref:Uncharacterized protein n=1 Tax=Pagothenia borchgrevinki TaxID=8213 RepID=A0ABD2HCU6_PAGBO